MNKLVALFFSLAISGFAVADEKPEIYRDPVTVTGGVRNLSEVLEGCELHTGLFLANRFQYSDSGNTIKLIQFQRGDGEVFAIPTNFETLDKYQYVDLLKLLREGRSYWISFSVCGSGGFTSLVDLSYTFGF